MDDEVKPSKAAKNGDTSLTLAALRPDHDTRDLFARLMKDAERGDIVGAMVVKIHRKKDKNHPLYTCSVSGRAASNATFALGAATVCMQFFRDLAQKQAGIE